MAMKTKQKLPSCTVSKGLLRQLEDFVLGVAAKRNSISEQEARRQYKLRITDPFGVETLHSASSVPGDLLPDNVSEIEVSYVDYGKPLSQFAIVFRVDGAEALLDVEGEDARPLSAGTLHELQRMVAAKRRAFSVSGFVYEFLPFALYGAAAALLIFSLMFIVKPPASVEVDWKANGFLLVVLLFGGLALKSLRVVSPRVFFDTRKNEEWSKNLKRLAIFFFTILSMAAGYIWDWYRT